jgi:RNA polymerase sigma-70 factor (ECF subfamily)
LTERENDMIEVANHDIIAIQKGCQHGDRLSQKQLYNYCFSVMMKVCIRYHKNMDDAAHSFNAAMLKVFKNIHQFRGDGDLMAWIRRIVVNTCLTAVKSQARFEYRELEEVSNSSFEPEVYQHLQAKEILDLVHELENTQRLVFNLFVMEGFTHDEIAQQLNIPKGTSKWYLHEARKQLKEKIKLLTRNEINSNAI